MTLHEQVEELQNLFDENESLIENNCARLNQLQQELSQEEVSFLEVKDKLIKLLQQLKVSYGSTQPYTTYLQESPMPLALLMLQTILICSLQMY